MKQHFVSLATWINTDPRRLRFISASFVASMTLLALAFPEAVAFAGWAPGGSD